MDNDLVILLCGDQQKQQSSDILGAMKMKLAKHSALKKSEKQILRDMASRHIPNEIALAAKQGFSAG